MVYMQKVTTFPPKAINLAYFTENNEKCESKFNLQLCQIWVCTLRKKVQLRTLFVPYLEPSGKKVPKRNLYMFKNLKKVLKMVIKNLNGF